MAGRAIGRCGVSPCVLRTGEKESMPAGSYLIPVRAAAQDLLAGSVMSSNATRWSMRLANEQAVDKNKAENNLQQNNRRMNSFGSNGRGRA